MAQIRKRDNEAQVVRKIAQQEIGKVNTAQVQSSLSRPANYTLSRVNTRNRGGGGLGPMSFENFSIRAAVPVGDGFGTKTVVVQPLITGGGGTTIYNDPANGQLVVRSDVSQDPMFWINL